MITGVLIQVELNSLGGTLHGPNFCWEGRRVVRKVEPMIVFF